MAAVRALYETLRAELLKREATLREAGAVFAYESEVAELEGWLRERREPLLSSEVRAPLLRSVALSPHELTGRSIVSQRIDLIRFDLI